MNKVKLFTGIIRFFKLMDFFEVHRLFKSKNCLLLYFKMFIKEMLHIKGVSATCESSGGVGAGSEHFDWSV